MRISKTLFLPLGLLAVTACGDDNDDPSPGDELMACAAQLHDPGNASDGDASNDDDATPAPPSIGSDIPLTYFGPPPSAINPRLIGPHQLLTAGQVDLDAGTVTLPLYEGRLGTAAGAKIWYVLTDTTDKDNAAGLGLNHSGKLAYAAAAGSRASRTGRYVNDANGLVTLVFDQGTVNYAPALSVTPGAAPNLFPPAAVQPGSVGDANYSPLVRIENAGGHIYNAPMIAMGEPTAFAAYCEGAVDARGRTLFHDKVVHICPPDDDNSVGTVTLQLTSGFSFGRPVLYLSLDASVDAAAALENVNYAPALGAVNTGGDDSAFSAVERIFVTVNGPTNLPNGTVNPQRQGLYSALSGQGGPLNVLGGIPTVATDYSPLWDVNFGVWTEAAIARGYRSRLTEEFQILGMAARGFLTGVGGAPYGSSGPIVNCPIVHRFL
ncbi:MAG: hypothetical protein HC863_03235 [Myxococcales bacterium]|nr:hypothetical protein [Myxococcales bacterium]